MYNPQIMINYFQDIDECARGTDDCHVNATCFNTDGSFICVCNDGFTGNGKQCDGTFLCILPLGNLLEHNDSSW